MDWRTFRDEVVHELTQLIGSRAILRSSVLQKVIRRIGELDAKGEDTLRDLETYRLDRVRIWLREVRSQRRDVHQSLVKALLRAKTEDTFYGFMFEVYLAWKLVKSGLQFQKSERPDFQIGQKPPELGIECLSLRSTVDWGAIHSGHSAISGFPIPPRVERGALHTIQGKIRGKSDKPYALRSVALAVNVTNLGYHELQHLGFDTLVKVLWEEARSAARDSLFGSVVFVMTTPDLWPDGRTNWRHLVLREDAAEIVTELRDVLDRIFAVEMQGTQVPAIPFEG